jgi:hypothetical protein
MFLKLPLGLKDLAAVSMRTFVRLYIVLSCLMVEQGGSIKKPLFTTFQATWE